MSAAFQDFVRNIIGELNPAIRVECLPPRETPHDDPVYPVRFKTDTAELIVAFPHRMVFLPEGKEEVYETVARVVRLLNYFQRRRPHTDLIS